MDEIARVLVDAHRAEHAAARHDPVRRCECIAHIEHAISHSSLPRPQRLRQVGASATTGRGSSSFRRRLPPPRALPPSTADCRCAASRCRTCRRAAPEPPRPRAPTARAARRRLVALAARVLTHLAPRRGVVETARPDLVVAPACRAAGAAPCPYARRRRLGSLSDVHLGSRGSMTGKTWW